MNLKDQIAQARDVKLQPVEVPEWGVTVYLKELTVGERLALYDVMTDDANKDRLLYVYAILYSVCDQDGNRAFGLEDYDLVANKNADVVLRIGKEAARHNKLIGDAIDDAKKN